jgi:hypothetical protein
VANTGTAKASTHSIWRTAAQKRSASLDASAEVSSPVWSFSMTASCVSASISTMMPARNDHAQTRRSPTQ